MTAAWRVAPALDALLGQLNALAPGRSKASDGSIGDQAHSVRVSDHNPATFSWSPTPLVLARDFTHHPAGGLDCHQLAEALRTARDSRVRYVIWNHRILSGAAGPQPWAWRAYGGANPHTKHLHLSVVGDRRALDPGAWDLPGLASSPTLRQGSRSRDVRTLQAALGLTVDGAFGPDTDRAVRAFQKAHGLAVDGVCGPATWAKLRSVAA